MNYLLHWTPEAKESFDDFTQLRKDRSLILAVTHALEYALKYDPYTSGKYYHEGLWSIELHPIKLIYEIDGQARLVSIVSAACTDKTF